jgi:hypothetical protein
MEDAFELAGYFGAHAIWCVSDADTLVPMLAVQRPDGSVQMTRFEGPELQASVSKARDELESNSGGNVLAALFYDAHVNLPDGKTDAVMVEIVEYPSGKRASIALPYRHASHPDGFAVFRPKFLGIPDPARSQLLGEALFRGVEKHEKGAAVWSSHLDESR